MKAIEINIDDMIAKKYEAVYGPRVEGDEIAYMLFSHGFYSGFSQGIRTATNIVNESPNEMQMRFNFNLI